MSLFDWIGRGLKWGGAALAAPVTGGASLWAAGLSEGGDLLSRLGQNGQGESVLSAFGSGAGDAATAAALGRGARAAIMRDLMSDLESQLLAREGEKRTARSDAMRNALLSDALLNFQGVDAPAHIPVTNFGLQVPGAEGRSALEAVLQQAQTRLNSPDLMQDTGLAPYEPLLPADEVRERFRESLDPGWWETAGAATGAAAPLLDAFLQRIFRQGNNDPASGENRLDSIWNNRRSPGVPSVPMPNQDFLGWAE